MANIMINETCNQKCPYCFASEFVNVEKKNISLDNFIKATNFILTEKEKRYAGRIGIIGGEPLLHPDFDTFIKYLTENEAVKMIVVFTNGVLIKKHLDSILNDKVALLINVNSVDNVGLDNYKDTEESINLLVNKYRKKRVTLGLNIYDNIDYSFFIDMAEKYNQDLVRLSVVVPTYGKEKRGFDQFLKLKDTILKITKKLLVKDVSFKFDCNLPIHCMWDDAELDDLKKMGLSGGREKIPWKYSCCTPVIDILPDLKAVRCFGLSDKSKVDISDFSTIGDLRSYYIEKLDSILSRFPIREKCKTCDLFPKMCFGGCLANRVE